MGRAAAPTSEASHRGSGAVEAMLFQPDPPRYAAHAGLASALLLLAPPALAQEPGEVLEQIIVTGSRIARPDFESASPIVSVTADAFARTSSTSVESANTDPSQYDVLGRRYYVNLTYRF